MFTWNISRTRITVRGTCRAIIGNLDYYSSSCYHFSKLHMAINAQKAGSTLAELKQLLLEIEDNVLGWYLGLYT